MRFWMRTRRPRLVNEKGVRLLRTPGHKVQSVSHFYFAMCQPHAGVALPSLSIMLMPFFLNGRIGKIFLRIKCERGREYE